MGTTHRMGDWWYLSTGWKGNLLVNLQIKAEVIHEEVNGNDLLNSWRFTSTTSLSSGLLAEVVWEW